MIFFIISFIGVVLHNYVFFISNYYISEILGSFIPYMILTDSTIIIRGLLQIFRNRKYTIHLFLYIIIIVVYGLFLYENLSKYYTAYYNYNKNSLSNISSIDSKDGISFLYANIYYKNHNFSGLLETIQTTKPDIIMFVEYAKIHDGALSDILKKEYPYKNRYVGGKHFDGDIILSRYPIKKIEHKVIPGSRSFTHVSIKKSPLPLDIALIHTSAPVSNELFKQRNQQMEKLIEILGTYYGDQNNLSKTNLIVLGDFNVSPRSIFYQEFDTKIGYLGLHNISTDRYQTNYSNIFPSTRCHESLQFLCSHIDHIWSNNTGLIAQHIDILGSDHDGFVGKL